MLRRLTLIPALLSFLLAACAEQVPAPRPPIEAQTPAPAQVALPVMEALVPGSAVCLERPPLVSGPPDPEAASWLQTWYGDDAIWLAPASVAGNRWQA